MSSSDRTSLASRYMEIKDTMMTKKIPVPQLSIPCGNCPPTHVFLSTSTVPSSATRNRSSSSSWTPLNGLSSVRLQSVHTTHWPLVQTALESSVQLVPVRPSGL